jgi:single-stranded DNA-binding protein
MIITGNIGRAAEKKMTKSNREYLAFSVAESYGKEDNRTTNWFSIAFYCKPEEMDHFHGILTQGVRVEVQGDLKVNPTMKDGKPVVYLDMMTSRVKLAPLPPKKDGAPAGQTSTPAAAPAPAPAPAGGAGGIPDKFDDSGLDDDIPF